MRHFYKKDGEVTEFLKDQLTSIDKSYKKMTDEEIDQHLNPMKYWTPEQLAEYNRTQMPNLTPIEFDVKLIDAGLYEQVQNLVDQDLKLKVAYTRATFFSRTDPFIEQARIALGLTNEQVDAMWVI